MEKTNKKIAVITGAGSGIGKEFAQRLQDFGTFDEVWVLGRNVEKLQALCECVQFPLHPIAADLSCPAGLETYESELKNANVTVDLLINCSGFGKFDATMNIPLADNLNMIDLNCRGTAAMCQMTVPFMTAGSRIINIASVAAFQPIPYINVYAATKAFVLYYSRALNRELKMQGIRVMAVCPFWTKTNFFNRAVNTDKDAVVKKYVAMYQPEQIVKRACRDMKRGKDVSKFGFIARAQAAMVKAFPQSWIMSIWMSQQKLK